MIAVAKLNSTRLVVLMDMYRYFIASVHALQIELTQHFDSFEYALRAWTAHDLSYLYVADIIIRDLSARTRVAPRAECSTLRPGCDWKARAVGDVAIRSLPRVAQ